MITNQDNRKEGRSANIGFAKWRVSCFYDSLVQGSSSVFQMNICAENPPLRKAEKRYLQQYFRASENVLLQKIERKPGIDIRNLNNKLDDE
jgi:hypothetical protein